MPYQARSQSLFQPGGPNSVSHPIDVGGLIDAATNGATTLIQNAYMRKTQDRTAKLAQDREDLANRRANDQFEFERTKEKNNHEYRMQQADTAQKRWEAEEAYKAQKDARDFMEKGGTPGSTSITTQPAEAPPPIAQSFGQAMSTPGALNAGAAMPTPVAAAPSLGSIPRLTVTSTADSIVPKVKHTRTPFMEDGKPMLGSMDEHGNLYRDDGTPVSGKVSPYVAPEKEHFTTYQDTGPDGKPRTMRLNTSTGQSEAVGGGRVTTGGKGAAATQDERYAAQHLPILAQGVTDIAAATAPSAWSKISQRNMLGNYTLGPEAQKYNAAVNRAALSAAVLMEGPRGATPQRVDIVKKTYFPAPGDDPATVSNKLERLYMVVQSGKERAGRAYESIDPAQRSVVERIGGQSSGAPAGANPFEGLVPKAKP